MARLNAHMSKSTVCCRARPHLTLIPCLSSPCFRITFTYANDSAGDVIELHSFSVIFHTQMEQGQSHSVSVLIAEHFVSQTAVADNAPVKLRLLL